MKIIAVIDNTIGTGGGFDQALNAVLQMQRLCDGRHEFEVFTSKETNLNVLAQMHVKAECFRYGWIDRFLAITTTGALWSRVQQRTKLVGPFEKRLLKHHCDLVYFVTPTIMPLCLQKINYITTVWDQCHRDTPEFPEVREFGNFFVRDTTYRQILAPSLVVVTDSQRLADLASCRYGVDRERFLAMPFGYSPLIQQTSSTRTDAVLKKYKLSDQYFYYPAQFWAHKNHVRIVEALSILKEKHSFTPTLVFSGKDHGNLSWVKEFISSRDLNSQVKIIGFVPSSDIRGLYQGAVAVVMPTYFGPTNLPPLEAWSVGTPLIYSAHLKDQVEDAALLVDPDDASSIADAMMRVTQQHQSEALVNAGKRRLEYIHKERAVAEESLLNFIDKFARRRLAWR